jgi:HxlR-like helix-turn-helix
LRYNGDMKGHGQFCSIAGGLEVLGGQCTLLVVRQLLGGSRRFNNIRRGIPRISHTMLSERSQGLAFAAVVTPEWFHQYLFAGIGPVRNDRGPSAAKPAGAGRISDWILP